MIKPLLTMLIISLLVCITGMTVIWVVGSYLACFFVSDCYQTLGAAGVLSTISVKSILSKGVLLALVFTIFGWLKMRQR